jgi:signal transduction histidine kinase
MFENKTGLLIKSVVGVSSIVRDIAHRKQIEAALRERDALRYVASLAAAAAHEINNPLAVVVGEAQLLAEEVDAARRRRIEKILEAVGRIQGIVDQLKHINRLELMDAALLVPEMLDLEKSSLES